MRGKIILTEEGNALSQYVQAISQVGEGGAKRAFRLAMNETGRKSFTAIKRALRTQTSIPAGRIAKHTKFRPATTANLETVTSGTGREIPLREFGAKQFGYGVRARVWGKFQKFPSTFIVARYSGGVFKRLGPRRFPIEQLYGPSIAKEIVKDETLATFEQGAAEVGRVAIRIVGAMLQGKVSSGRR